MTRKTPARTGALKRWNRVLTGLAGLRPRRLATNMEGMLREQERQGERLDKLEGKPGENWNGMVKSILAAIGSAIGGGLVVAIATMLIK